ncbi:type II CRISPR-associated endonuclease Cas1 [Belliella kenyensis]|uniref:CRISPR-associated endonuclease Cas1 n=1 Tax=Belliella kenyensis TaxID=1472724 RepID=A0ABV8ELW5_9BACT|nr:type II CRISPR-associated endonuclease Cas1 [Belliella kenyensis]MCH7400296.1 type II CRISPR-associated endonuclease Cas1 [Belliella kenyensis]MDN3604686.1 type II CRISPR-associated endonuclease Cas1 [Belliella kenyensis]MDN3605276.1 type II CRISPR-associated endonuclease Cas1 [Belliella kenyensis]
MIKRTLFFGNPAYLSTKNEQLHISFPEEDKADRAVPIEDLGMIVLENQQITITNGLLAKLTDRKVAIVSCNAQHLPEGLLLPMQGHSEQTERVRYQLEASQPLKKNLWQQTVTAKIKNQYALLQEKGKESKRMEYLYKNVNSGDSGNHEAQAAAIYWQELFEIPDFNRGQMGIPPNNLLNYGYAILRAVIARALVSSGMLPGVGIWHRNKYNAYCLADDIMEPYRPYVDLVVSHIVETQDEYSELTTELKKELLSIPALDVNIDGQKSPLMVAASRTTTSLFECFAGISRKIIYPEYG